MDYSEQEIWDKGENMSSRLTRAKRKEKNRPKYGWMETEIKAINQYQDRLNWMSKMSGRAYLNMKEIALWVLHDKFGFGTKRLNRVSERVQTAVIKNDEVGVKVEQMIYYCKQKMDVDVYAECKRMTRKARYMIAGIEHPKNPRDMMEYTKAATMACTLGMCMICVELQEIEKFSKNQIRKFVGECVALINDYLDTGYITQEDVRNILKLEVKFDMRGSNNGKQENSSANMGKSNTDD